MKTGAQPRVDAAPDFASAAMMRLVARGLQRQGIALQQNPSRAALVPLENKRLVLGAVWEAHGPQALLNIGQAVNDINDEPTLVALALAQDFKDLMQRWSRLERFVHSRHRVTVESQCATDMRLRHVSLAPGEPPHAAESLLVFGLLIALAQRIGTQQLRARVQGDLHWRWRSGEWATQHLPVDVSAWELAWQPASAPVIVPAAIALAGADRDWPRAVALRLAQDPARQWTIGIAATELNTTTRTLQRRLHASKSTFSALLTTARAAHAARMLATSATAPAEIAFASGFADQAHFTREFKRVTAITPSVYRQQFAQERA